MTFFRPVNANRVYSWSESSSILTSMNRGTRQPWISLSRRSTQLLPGLGRLKLAIRIYCSILLSVTTEGAQLAMIKSEISFLILSQWILPPGLQYDPQFCVWMKWLSFPFPTLLTPPFLRLVAIFNSVVWPVNIIPREGELSSHALAHRFSFDPTKTGKGNRLWTETSYKSSLMCVDESVYMFVFGARLCYRGQGDNSQTCEMSLTCLMKVPSNAARTIRGGTN